MAGMQETDHITLKNGITYLLQDAKARKKLAELLVEVMEKYGADNPPPYPVTSVNGQTGDVTVQGGSGSGIAIQDDEPTDGELVWIDTDDSGTTHIIPEIDDTQESAVDTWSSQKIAEEFAGVLPLGEVTTKIPSGADLNDYFSPGVYAIGSNNTAATIANMPSQSAGTLRVFASTGAAITASSIWKYLIQEYITFTGERYQRYGGSGSGTAVAWDAWHQQILDFEIGNVIKTAEFKSSSFTVAANRNFSIDIPVSLSGFTPIGIVCITGSGNGNATIVEFNLTSSSTGVIARIYGHNTTSSAITINYYRVTVLFIKSA